MEKSATYDKAWSQHPLKFLRRNITLDNKHWIHICRKIRTKGLSVRKLNIEISARQAPKNIGHYFPKKSFKLLTHTDLDTYNKRTFLHRLKDSYYLRSFTLGQEKANNVLKCNSIETNTLFKCLRRLSKSTLYINLYMLRLKARKVQLYYFYRILSSFKKLVKFSRVLNYGDAKQDYNQLENKLISQSFARAPNFQKFIYYDVSFPNQKAFNKLMETGRQCSKLTDLTVCVDDDLLENTGFEDNTFAEQNIESSRRFINFDLFHNLETLTLITTQCDLSLLKLSIIKAFSSLKSLKNFSLDTTTQPAGSYHIFEGMSQLRQLNHFSLRTKSLEAQDVTFLTQFLMKQRDLESLELIFEPLLTFHHPKKVIIERVKGIGSILEHLQYKPKLKNMLLYLDYYPLDYLSKALGKLDTIDSLKSLQIQAYLISTLSQQVYREHTEGLCQLILNQRKSLENLTFLIRFSCGADILAYIFQTISELRNLKKLNICIIYERPLIKGKETKQLDLWYPQIIKILESQQVLEEFSLQFLSFEEDASEDQGGFLQVLELLSNMRTLKVLNFEVPFGVSKHLRDPLDLALLKFKNVKHMKANFMGKFALTHGNYMHNAIDSVNLRQSVRADLMF